MPGGEGVVSTASRLGYRYRWDFPFTRTVGRL